MYFDRRQVARRLSRIVTERLTPAVYGERAAMTVRRWDVAGEPVPVAQALAADYLPATVGEGWGPAWGTTWFELTADVPPGWSGGRVEGVVDLGFDGTGPGFAAEGLVYRSDGTAVKGLHPHNRWFPVESDVGQVRVLVEAAANPLISIRTPEIGDVETASADPIYVLRQADLGRVDVGVRELIADLEVLGELAAVLDENEPRCAQIWAGLSDALDVLDLHNISGSVPPARAVLTPLLAKPAHASAHQISAVGHAHIDSAWLWPLRETVRKVARTCANVTQLMDDHPQMIFAMSQAQQLAWIEEHRPEVFARVREKIETHQFVPVGSLWVESDTNMPAARRWPDSSFTASATTWRSSASTHPTSGCRTPSATRPPCRS